MTPYQWRSHALNSIDDLPDYLFPKPLLSQGYEDKTKECTHVLMDYSGGALAISIKHKPFVSKKDEED
jgi:hypothetical protein